MKKCNFYFVFLVLILFCSSCDEQLSTSNFPQPIQTEEEKMLETIQLDMEMPIITPSKIMIYPITLSPHEKSEKKFKLKGFSHRSDSYFGSSYNAGENQICTNLLFYDAQKQQRHFLLQEINGMLTDYDNIVDYYLPPKKDEKSFSSKRVPRRKTEQGILLYRVIKEDYNQNGMLDYRDPQVLYRSDSLGQNLVQLTPDHFDVTDWYFPFEGESILEVRGIIDANKDRKYNPTSHADYIEVWLLDALNPKNKVVVLDSTQQNQLKEPFIKEHQ